MPCDSSYLNPSEGEKDAQELAQHIVFVFAHWIKGKGPNRIIEAAESIYGKGIRLDEDTAWLCGMMKQIDANNFVVDFVPRNWAYYSLMAWWERHKEADKKRLEDDEKRQKDEADMKAAIAKLTEYERKLLKLE